MLTCCLQYPTSFVNACFMYFINVSSRQVSSVNLLQEEELRGAAVLIFANKQDLLGALDDATVTESLELHKIKNQQWAIFKTSAIKGEGLLEGLDW
ncbi:hypothetical protein ES319_D05G341600v1 [Gossypium barbadense]|uniref:Uncharacterized protein n=2 Tax=Gossypium TaxID=3633 RepID=A0A5J5RL84_GOSBA|nr:hypothetical protein ES319_D05G341600v1 [Gossypium barbadense]TYG71032.1 hypothetical protein ES288_D05G362000v1 [Gossypium darwinii]